MNSCESCTAACLVNFIISPSDLVNGLPRHLPSKAMTCASGGRILPHPVGSRGPPAASRRKRRAVGLVCEVRVAQVRGVGIVVQFRAMVTLSGAYILRTRFVDCEVGSQGWVRRAARMVFGEWEDCLPGGAVVIADPEARVRRRAPRRSRPTGGTPVAPAGSVRRTRCTARSCRLRGVSVRREPR